MTESSRRYPTDRPAEEIRESPLRFPDWSAMPPRAPLLPLDYVYALNLERMAWESRQPGFEERRLANKVAAEFRL